MNAIREFDPDGSGPRPAQAVVLGEIDLADGTPLKDFGAFAPGEGWSGGLQTIRGTVYSLQVFNDGTGRRLFAAGSFRVGPGGEHETVLRWSGSEWEVPGGGPGLVPNSSMRALTVHNDGSGWALYGLASEPVPNSYYIHTSRIARWDGHAWVKAAAPANSSTDSGFFRFRRA